MKKLMAMLGAIALTGTFLVAVATPVQAAVSSVVGQYVCLNSNALAGCSGATKAQCANAVDVKKCQADANNLGGANGYLSFLVDAFIYVGAIISVIFILIGSIRYITSAGDSTKIQSAKNTVLYSVIGLIVMILARVITAFVIHGVNKVG